MCIKPNIYLAYRSNAMVPCHSSGKASYVTTEFNFVTDKTMQKWFSLSGSRDKARSSKFPVNQVC